MKARAVFRSRKDTAVFLPRPGSTIRTLDADVFPAHSCIRNAPYINIFRGEEGGGCKLRSNGGSGSRRASRKLTYSCGFFFFFFFLRIKRFHGTRKTVSWLERVKVLVESVSRFSRYIVQISRQFLIDGLKKEQSVLAK